MAALLPPPDLSGIKAEVRRGASAWAAAATQDRTFAGEASTAAVAPCSGCLLLGTAVCPTLNSNLSKPEESVCHDRCRLRSWRRKCGPPSPTPSSSNRDAYAYKRMGPVLRVRRTAVAALAVAAGELLRPGAWCRPTLSEWDSVLHDRSALSFHLAFGHSMR